MNKMENSELPSIKSLVAISHSCRNILDSLYPVTKKAVKEFFQKIAEWIIAYVKAAENYCKETKPTKLHCHMVLAHLMKFYSLCELFSSKYLNFTEPLPEEDINELMRCARINFNALLKEGDEIFSQSSDTKNDVGFFVKLVNVALEKIEEIDVSKGSVLAGSTLDEARNIIEEILCFSMAVAQVAMDDDPKIITARCQLVLGALENIKIEIEKDKPNQPTCHLVVDNCSDALCELEAQVNITVLRLCLNVFSDYKQPLKNLIENSRDEAVISNFDLNMDRIFQISSFSLASSSLGKVVVSIKVNMANLEFLETELIPLIIAKTGYEETAFTTLLQKFWYEQVRRLRENIHKIIEPSAYCKLIYEELQSKIDAYWINICNAQTLQTCQLEVFIKYTEELIGMVTACFASFKQEQQTEIKEKLKIVMAVLKELKLRKESLEKDGNSNVMESNRSLFKRCQVLVKAIKQLWAAAADENEDCLTFKVEDTICETNVEVDAQLTYIKNKSTTFVKSRKITCTDHVANIISMTNTTRTINHSDRKNSTHRMVHFTNKHGEKTSVNDMYSVIEKTFCDSTSECNEVK